MSLLETLLGSYTKYVCGSITGVSGVKGEPWEGGGAVGLEEEEWDEGRGVLMFEGVEGGKE